MLCRDNEHHDSQMQAAITYGKLRQHFLRQIVFRHLNGVTATAPGLMVGHAMGLRLRSRPAKAGSLCPAGQQVACQVQSSDVGCKSHARPACIRDRKCHREGPGEAVLTLLRPWL